MTDENLTPEEYELHVKRYIERFADDVKDFYVTHRERHTASEGEFEIDITVRFQLLDVEWVVLIECKRYKNPIERKVVMELQAKKEAVKADKAMIFTTSTYQTGAIEYAHYHGIILYHFQKALLERFGGNLSPIYDYPILIVERDAQGKMIVKSANEVGKYFVSTREAR
jgi:restriction system protein